MSKESKQKPRLPEQVAAIAKRGLVVWKGETLKPEFRAHFDPDLIPVVGIRHVRVWDIQVDDERALPGRERTWTGNEELWEIRLRARDGTTYEVDSTLVAPAPD
jgi:hypothetical protein